MVKILNSHVLTIFFGIVPGKMFSRNMNIVIWTKYSGINTDICYAIGLGDLSIVS